jgi:cytochrome P450
MSAADLSVEATLAVVAGSDTTGTALANTIYYLICYPEVFARLRAELDVAAGQGAGYDELIDSERLAELKYLQAVINETLRLQPAVPNGIQRSIPIQDGVLPVAGQ